MNNVGKVFIKMGLLSLLSVMPLAAQIDNGVDFTASFPFYAGNAKLPAGNYKVVQPDDNADILQIENQRRSALGVRRFHTNRVYATSPQTLLSPSRNMEIRTISIEFGLKVRNMA